ncbi:MAG: alkaline phosphatase family protein [Actinomycetota bacterium]
MSGIPRRKFLLGAASAALGGPYLIRAARAAGTSTAVSDCPVDHIVVLTMENRSFDHFFGSLSLREGRAEVDGLAGGERNAWSSGEEVEAFQLSGTTCNRLDPPHEWESSRLQWNLGANDGYLRAVEHHYPEASDPTTRPADAADVMGFYVRDDLPFSYGVADEFAICQRYFSPVGAPTLPNRHYLHCATSGGLKDNYLDSRGPGGSPSPQGDPTYGFDFLTIYERMSQANVDWRVYFTEAPFTMLYRWPRLNHPERFAPMAQFYADAAAGNLPSFTTIDPGYFTASDHAPQNVQLGQLFIASVYYALAASPAWERTALIVTYDEDGGFYDHVPHLRGLPDDHTSEVLDDDFSKSGGRLPTMLMGPWVRQRHVSDVEADHTSILALAEWRFGLDPLTQRDEARLTAGQNLLDCFDFGGSARRPVALPVPSFHASMFTDCGSTYVAPPAPYVPGPREPSNPGLDLNEALMLAVNAGAIPLLDPTVTRKTLLSAFGMAEAAAATRLGPRAGI